MRAQRDLTGVPSIINQMKMVLIFSLKKGSKLFLDPPT